jgi:galactofuranosylgalactofuranosylrhamnosyl-N-acetylglucosaminyl-diphospho-decaprenol beta-1,5/1,6-galactofuranosyltransferase
LPYFIKWDDAEYSLRARKAGYPTVSLPGAAVWHVSWVDKDDSHDWQAYFHARNRLVTALMYSPEHKGGLVRRGNLAVDMKNLLTMDYYTVEMRLQAVENVLEGPEQLHDDIIDRLPKVRALGKQFTESTIERELEKLPHFPAREIFSVTTGVSDPGPYGNRLWRWLAKTGLRHAFVPVPADVSEKPELHLSFQDARWFETSNHDSILVSNAEGSGASWHLRKPKLFREQVLRSLRLNNLVYNQWNELRKRYLAALPEITSMERWEETFRKTGSL